MTTAISSAPARDALGAVDQFNRIRGRLVGFYAKLEQASADAIALLDPGTKIPVTLKPRLTRLRELLHDKVAEKTEKKILQSIDELEAHLTRRNILVHASGSLLTGSDDQWRWTWRMADGEQRGWWMAAEMLEFEKDCHSRVDRLCAHLATLKNKAGSK